VKQIQGIAAARGFAVGPAYQFHKADLQVNTVVIADPKEEIKRFEKALVTATEQVQAVYEKAKIETSVDSASIFEAHVMMLQDPELLETIRTSISEKEFNAEMAVKEATEYYARTLDKMGNEYFRSRAADVRDISDRLVRVLLGVDTSASGILNQPSIIIARDLTPSDTVMLEKSLVLGFCTVEGSETSHTAILARGLSIPAVVGSGVEILDVPTGDDVILDGLTGKLIIEPTPELTELYEARKISFDASAGKAATDCLEPAITLDGCKVEVVANIGSVTDAQAALDNGAEGVGLLRSEFLYMERKTLPNEEEQWKAYTAILDVFGQLPVVLRTSDIGGDKELPYLHLAKETNPFLGVRGLRLALLHPEELLKPQLRAALRAGSGHDLRIMFPMVAALDEVRQAQRIVQECQAELVKEGKPVDAKLQVGIMVEVPSAALMADKFAPAVDFFSIGTNDLTQYTLAVDRTNSQLAHLTSAFSPAVLRLIQNVILQAHKHGKWVGLCGELAGEPLAIPILLGLGLDEFSMNPSAIPSAKQIIRSLNLYECQKLAEKILNYESAEEVKSLVEKKIQEMTFRKVISA
jgi:phosphoenolpyruvate-protein phosphotransferase (PTS system enzyme I)